MALSSKDTPAAKSVRTTTPEQHTEASDASAARAESQTQTDRVAMVSRTATGEAHQHPGYEVIGVPEEASEAERAAAENRPEQRPATS